MSHMESANVPTSGRGVEFDFGPTAGLVWCPKCRKLFSPPAAVQSEPREPELVDPRKLRPGPIRHGSLPPELLGKISAVFDVIGPYIGMTLEQFEIGFMRDKHPESEAALWCSIAAAWLAYHQEYLGEATLPDE